MVNNMTNHEKYLRNIRRRKIIVNVMRFLGILIFLLLWEVASNREWIDSFIFSSPTEVVKCFIDMLKNNDLKLHTLVTLKETFISFILLIVIALLVAMIMWRFNIVSQVLEPYLVVLNSLPKSALAPLMLVWFGANQKTIIISGISVGVFGAILSIYAGFLKVDNDQIKLIETLKGNKRQVMTKVILPSTMPIFVSVMKVNIGLCLVGVVIGEFFAANKGLGYLIIYGSQVFQLDMLIMSIVVLCIITIVFYQLIHLLEKSISKIFMM